MTVPRNTKIPWGLRLTKDAISVVLSYRDSVYQNIKKYLSMFGLNAILPSYVKTKCKGPRKTTD